MNTTSYVLPPSVSKSREFALKGRAKPQASAPALVKRSDAKDLAGSMYPNLPSIHDKKPGRK